MFQRRHAIAASRWLRLVCFVSKGRGSCRLVTGPSARSPCGYLRRRCSLPIGGTVVPCRLARPPESAGSLCKALCATRGQWILSQCLGVWVAAQHGSAAISWGVHLLIGRSVKLRDTLVPRYTTCLSCAPPVGGPCVPGREGPSVRRASGPPLTDQIPAALRWAHRLVFSQRTTVGSSFLVGIGAPRAAFSQFRGKRCNRQGVSGGVRLRHARPWIAVGCHIVRVLENVARETAPAALRCSRVACVLRQARTRKGEEQRQ